MFNLAVMFTTFFFKTGWRYIFVLGEINSNYYGKLSPMHAKQAAYRAQVTVTQNLDFTDIFQIKYKDVALNKSNYVNCSLLKKKLNAIRYPSKKNLHQLLAAGTVKHKRFL